MFIISLKNVLITLLYILPGFILGKTKKAKAEHLSTLSNLLVFLLSPSMIANAFLSTTFTKETALNMLLYFVLITAVQGVFFLIVYLIFRKKYTDIRYKMFTVASFLGNVGFFGLPIVKVLFPTEPIVMCYSVLYSISMNLYVFTFVVYFLTNDPKYVSLKAAIINPSVITLLFSIPLYLLNVGAKVPSELMSMLSLFSNMTTPICMIILGVRLSKIPFKVLFTNFFAYFMAFGKLVIYPLFVFFLLYFVPLDPLMKSCAVILSACPCGAILLNMAEIYHKEEAITANALLLATLSCFLTIPLFSLLVQLF